VLDGAGGWIGLKFTTETQYLNMKSNTRCERKAAAEEEEDSKKKRLIHRPPGTVFKKSAEKQ
jgi:hypothetical protein